MAHTYSHEYQSTNYVGQILTLAACSAIACVCILLYAQGGLFNILKPDHHLPVLLGGVGLLLLALIRASASWIAARRSAAKSYNHIQSVDFDQARKRDLDHAGYELAKTGGHDRAHERAITSQPGVVHNHANWCWPDHAVNRTTAPAHLGWRVREVSRPRSNDVAPWRCALMLLPLVLFLLGLPQAGGMNADNFQGAYGKHTVDGMAAKQENLVIDLDQLVHAARNPGMRDELAGSTVRLSGQYRGDQSDRFTLVRFKVDNHDGNSLKAAVIVDSKAGDYPINPETYRNQWVQITGRLAFSKDSVTGDAIPVILLSPKKADDQDVVKIIPPESNP